MILLDVNVLVYAHRDDTPHHAAIRSWLESVVSDDSAFCVPELVLSGFLRVVTHPRIFAPPTPLEQALGVVEGLRSQPNFVVVAPGPRHWGCSRGFVGRPTRGDPWYRTRTSQRSSSSPATNS